jgi:cell division protein FtsQ
MNPTADTAGRAVGETADDPASTVTKEFVAPRIDPRMRERWVEARRREGRRRLRALIAVMAVLLTALAALGLTRSPLLAVHRVQVSGGVHTSRQAVVTATGLGRQPQMLDLNVGQLRHKLTALPWVASASVTRHWPATVVIRLTEREPLAVVTDAQGQPLLVDDAGRILDGAGPDQGQAQAQPGGLPVIQGLVAPDGGSIDASGEGRDALKLAKAVPVALPPGSPLKLRTIVLAPDGTLTATLTPNVTVVFGTADVLDAKLLAVRTLLERVDPSSIATMDVRVPDSPILTHVGQGSTVSTTPRG